MEKNIEVEKSIEALLVEPGKAPRKITVRNSKEGVAEVLGEGTLETVGVHHQCGAVAAFLSVVMIWGLSSTSRKATAIRYRWPCLVKERPSCSPTTRHPARS